MLTPLNRISVANKELENTSDNLEKRIENSIHKIQMNSFVKKNINILNLISKINNSDDDSTKASRKKIKKKARTLDDFLKDMEIPVESITDDAKRRKKLYSVYKFIDENIPIIDQALDIMSDAIISPEPSNKNDIFIIKSQDEKVVALAKSLLEEINLPRDINSIIRKSLRYGDEFIEIVDTNIIDNLTDTTEKGLTNLQEQETEALLESFTTEELLLIENKEAITENYKYEDFDQDLLLEAKAAKIVKGDNTIILKRHKAEDVVKIQLGEYVLGYLVLNQKEIADSKEKLFNYDNFDPNKEKKVEKLSNAISSKILKMINNQIKRKNNKLIDFIKNNQEYSQLVRSAIINNNSVSIRFVSPDNMVSFKHKSIDDPVYGESILKSVLLPIKHYLAVLTSNTIFNLTRAKETRKITVEVSNAELDAGASLNEVIKSLKKKEVALSNSLNDIESFSTELTAFDDIFIPSVNGETPIQIDSIPSQNNNIDPDYLESLKKIILGGIRVPKSLLNEYENSYHTSIAQENIMFAKQIIAEQANYAIYATELFNKVANKKGYTELVGLKLEFNAPTTLLNESLSNNINNIQTVVDYIASIVNGDDGAGEGTKVIDKHLLAKSLYPSIDWEKIDDVIVDSGLKKQEEDLIKKASGGVEGDDMGSVGGY